MKILDYMLPSQPSYEKLDGSFVHSIHSGKLSNARAFRAQSANFFYLCFCKFCHPIFSALHKAITVSFNRIACIFFLSSEVQMFRINAWRIIACMKHAHAFWNYAICQLPRKSMSQNSLHSSWIKSSITISFVAFSCPIPTSSSYGKFMNKFPKSLFIIPVLFQSPTSQSSKSSLLMRSCFGFTCSCLSTFFAKNRGGCAKFIHCKELYTNACA